MTGHGELELDRLTKGYGEVQALDGLTFTVPPGQVFGFLGPNGAGKTTAMRAIVGVAAMDGGHGALGRPADRRGGPPPDRLHAGGARAVPVDAGARSCSSTWPGCTA